ncbi:unnamed protein product [Clonostachys solani]|uniref:Uncharacterized protein n=1 Tax=Clonostachys solani TaxID=160281 RepID=A0A9N9ZI66_9HYPO|nr:unnamed protein product [Clonostachys solani]
MHANRKGTAWYKWYTAAESPEERKLLLKLDFLILPYALAMFWMYYVDASNIANAWVAGLAHDLGFDGNELVNFTSVGQAASIVGTIPFAYLFTRVPMNYLVPGIQLMWGVFTLVQFRANSYSAFMVLRFLVGFFEGPFFIAVQYVLGSWCKLNLSITGFPGPPSALPTPFFSTTDSVLAISDRPDEFGRRGCLFWFGLPLGGTTAGLIQSSASANLDGVAGLRGWRWMFVVVGAMTIIIAIIGFFLWPGTPDRPNKLVLSREEIALANSRHERYRLVAPGNDITTFSWSLIRQVVTTPFIYVLVCWNVLFWNADPTNWNGYLLWLNSLGRYSEAEVNRLGVTAPVLGILYAFFIAFGSDLWLGRTTAIMISSVANIIAMTILVVWTVPESALWLAYNLQYCVIILASVIYGWANDILRHNKQERAIALVFMQVIPSSIRAWIGLLVFKTVEAPRFLKGNSFMLANSVCLIAWTLWRFRAAYGVCLNEAAVSSENVEQIHHSPPVKVPED